MGKKILVILGVFAFVAIVTLGVTTCGVMKIADDWVKEKEPELRQYVQMNHEEQDAYIVKHMDELFRGINAYAESHKEESTPEEREAWAKFEQDPDAQVAGLQLGRSIVAALIMASEPITNGLSAEDKEMYEKESNEMNERTDVYTKIMEKYDIKKK